MNGESVAIVLATEHAMSSTIDDLVNARRRALGVQTEMMSEVDQGDEEEDAMNSEQLQQKIYRLTNRRMRLGNGNREDDQELQDKIEQLQDKVNQKVAEEKDAADVMQGRSDSEGGAGLDGMDDDDDDDVGFQAQLADAVKMVTTLNEEQRKQRNILEAEAYTMHGIVYEKRMEVPYYPMWRELGEEEPRNQPSYGASDPTLATAVTVAEPVDYERLLPHLIEDTFDILTKAQSDGIGSVEIDDIDNIVFQIDGSMKLSSNEDNTLFEMYPGSSHRHRRLDGLLNDTPYQHDVAVVRQSILADARDTTPYWHFAKNPPLSTLRHGDIAASMRHLVLNSALLSLTMLKTQILDVLTGQSGSANYTTTISTEVVDKIKSIVGRVLQIVYSYPADQIGNGVAQSVADFAANFEYVDDLLHAMEVKALAVPIGWVVDGDLIGMLKKSIVGDTRRVVGALRQRIHAIRQRVGDSVVGGNLFPMPPPPLFEVDSQATVEDY